MLTNAFINVVDTLSNMRLEFVFLSLFSFSSISGFLFFSSFAFCLIEFNLWTIMLCQERSNVVIHCRDVSLFLPIITRRSRLIDNCISCLLNCFDCRLSSFQNTITDFAKEIKHRSKDAHKTTCRSYSLTAMHLMNFRAISANDSCVTLLIVNDLRADFAG